jgi:DNA-binding LytR/AlgR family response regulator
MLKTCIIIDDEQHAIDTLTEYISQMPDFKLLKTYTNPVFALTDIMKHGDIDIIFLDIDMPGINGLELAVAIRCKTDYLVFTSSHAEYAINAFEVQADHYLLKPIALNKFLLTIDRLMIDQRRRADKNVSAPIYVRSEKKGKWVPIDLATIYLVEAETNYINIYSLTEKHTVYLTMKEIEEVLKRDLSFIRVHKSYIVSKKYIVGVSGKVITLKDNSTIIIGETYKDQFTRYFETVRVKSSRS